MGDPTCSYKILDFVDRTDSGGSFRKTLVCQASVEFTSVVVMQGSGRAIIIAMLQKIQELISQIQLNRQKSRDTASESSQDSKRVSKKWSAEEDNQLCDLIVRFGTDFTLLEEYLPHKTRKQIKRRYRFIFEYKQHKLQRIQHQFQKERRKSFFDDEILQENGSEQIKRKGSCNQRHSHQSDIQEQSFF